MNTQDNALELLDYLSRPGFSAENDRIVRVNPAARNLMLEPGMEVTALLATGAEEYRQLHDQCLCLTLTLQGREIPALVTRVGDSRLFLLEDDDRQLQSLALAARELREPLTGVMLAARELLSGLGDDPAVRTPAASLNRGLYQLLRIIGNMSDAARTGSRMELRSLCALADEIFEKAGALVETTGVRLIWQGLEEEIYGLTDPELLERAVFNLLSNALKFTPAGGTVTASLTRRGRMLHLTVCDSGCGIDDEIRGSLFSRYLRSPGIEDRRFGIGLGLVLVRSCAARHGGTVLIDQPGEGTRVTMTLAIRQDNVLRSPVLRVDYAGEQDHGLIELSDCLPAECYQPER